MLNARRRHRLDHPYEFFHLAGFLMCSTPGGVIVSITRVAGSQDRDIDRVLNARRRHRLDHSLWASPVRR